MESQFIEKNERKSEVQESAISNEIINKFREQDEYAVKYIFDTYFSRLYSYIYNEVEKNPAAAEDITQDTFIGAIKSAKKFNGECKVYTWLVSIAHHKIADYYRRLKREKSQSLDNIDPQIADKLVQEGAAVVNIIEATEDKLTVEQALLNLPEDYRRTLVLKYVEEMPVTEIGDIMKRSPKSVEGLLSRARKALREMLYDQSKG